MENTTILTYLFPSQPSPLQCSVSNFPANGFLNVVISAQGRTLYASEIDIYLPIGAGQEGYLTGNIPVATMNTTRWTVGTAELIESKDLPRGLQAEDVPTLKFSCFPQTPSDKLLNFDLQVSFNIQGVDSIPGPYTVGIGEYVSNNPMDSPSPNFGAFRLTKAAPTFFVDNLVVSATSGNVNVPFGSVPRNTPFILSWESNGTTYSIFTAKGSSPIYVGSNTQFQVPGITQDTTFILQAQITGGPQSGTTAPNFETISLYEAITVVCSNPDLTPHSIVNASTISSVGDISTEGNMVVSRDLTAMNLTINGQSKMSSVTVNSVFTTNGPVVLNGVTAKMIASPFLLASGSNTYSKVFTAPTDGTVVGYCGYPTNYNGTCVYWIFIVVNPVSAPSTSYQVGSVGGNINEAGQFISGPTTITLPVRSGDRVTIYSTAWNLNKITTNTEFRFFGFGTVAPVVTNNTASLAGFQPMS